ncbi:hypothetical protein H7J77_07215, partial [Mycolicibacillus parakoreensis]
MTAEQVWAPGIVHSLLADTEMMAELASSPPEPDHRHGSNIPGSTEFPPDWTNEILQRRVCEMLDHEGSTSWRSMRTTYVYYRDYGGVWPHVVVHGQPGTSRNVTAVVPFQHGPGIVKNRADHSPLVYKAITSMIDSLNGESDEWIDSFATVGKTLCDGGELAEA